MLVAKLLSISATNIITEFSYLIALSTNRTGSTTDFTYTSVSIGAADAGRVLILGVLIFNGSGSPGTSSATVTVGGITATLLSAGFNFGGFSKMAMYSVAVPTGTTATIVVTPNGTATSCGIGLWRMVNATSNISSLDYQSVINTAATPTTQTLIVNSGDDGYAIGFSCNTGSGTLSTWTGATENFDFDIRSGEFITGALASTTGGTTNISCTRAANQPTGYILTSWV